MNVNLLTNQIEEKSVVMMVNSGKPLWNVSFHYLKFESNYSINQSKILSCWISLRVEVKMKLSQCSNFLETLDGVFQSIIGDLLRPIKWINQYMFNMVQWTYHSRKRSMALIDVSFVKFIVKCFTPLSVIWWHLSDRWIKNIP